jgi:hypothetical protein
VSTEGNWYKDKYLHEIQKTKSESNTKIYKTLMFIKVALQISGERTEINVA